MKDFRDWFVVWEEEGSSSN